ncbi:MAG: hypothetical protein HC828_04915 [Blastochloris sp.]|nr:hypothetical protein [Blastochloris sp.]
MDLITTALVAALTAGTTEVGKKLFGDSYAKLKDAIVQRFGKEPPVTTALAVVEADPTSPGYQLALHEKLTAVQAEQDTTLCQLAQAILDQVQAQPDGTQHIQTIMGNYNAQATHGGTATVTIGSQSTDHD